jgi:hypothetical protein
MQCKNCAYLYVNAKTPFETTLGSREVGIKKNGRGGKFMYDIFDRLQEPI